MWIGASAPAGIDRAARLGDGWLADADLVPAEAAEQAAAYREACARGTGASPASSRSAATCTWARATRTPARVAAPIVDGGYRGFRPAAITYGRPEVVTEAFGAFAGMGYTDVIVRHLAEDQAEVIASLERLASVRAALSSR